MILDQAAAALAVLAAWSCHKNHAPCAAPSPALAKAGDGNAISQSRYRRIMRRTPMELGMRPEFEIQTAMLSQLFPSNFA